MLNLCDFTAKTKALFMLLFIAMTSATSAQHQGAENVPLSDREKMLGQLKEAQSIVAYRPEKARDMLNQYQGKLALLAHPEQVDWLLTLATVALELGDAGMLEQRLFALSPFIGTDGFTPFEQKSIAYAGHYFILLSQYGNARRAYLCALTKDGSTNDNIALLYSLAVLFAKSGDNQQARFVFLVLLKHVEGTGDLIHQARLENALGVIGLELKQYEDAGTRFKKAMELHQTSAKRSGHVNASLNLLLSYLLQRDFVKFQRLMPRIKLLLDDFPDTSKQVYLEFLVAAFKVLSGEGLSAKQKQGLSEAFNLLNNAMVKDAISKYLLEIVDIDGSKPSVLEKMQQQGKIRLEHFPVCDWQSLDDQQVMRSLSDLLK